MTPAAAAVEQRVQPVAASRASVRRIDDLQFETRLLRNARAEFVAVLGGAAGFGGDQAGAGDVARAHFVAADHQRLDRARDRRLADAPDWRRCPRRDG